MRGLVAMAQRLRLQIKISRIRRDGPDCPLHEGLEVLTGSVLAWPDCCFGSRARWSSRPGGAAAAATKEKWRRLS